MADKKISALTAASTPLDGTEVLPIVQSGATVKATNNDLRPKQIQSNATSGVLQIAGPGAATTRVMTTPNANFTAARTDAAQTFTAGQNFTANNIYNSFNSEAIGSNASPAFFGEKFYGYAGGQKAQTDGGDCSNSSFRGVYRIQTCDDGSQNMVTRMQFNGNSDISISTVNLKFDSGKGIDFSADSHAAGMTSELLDDYEEGTHTATVEVTTSGTITLDSTGDTLAYTKIGNLVNVRGHLSVSSVNSPSGGIRVSLPFTSAANTENSDVALCNVVQEGTTNAQTYINYIAASTNYIQVYSWTYAGGSISNCGNYVQTGTVFFVNATYQAV